MQNEPKSNGTKNGAEDGEREESERDYALDALQRIMQLKSRVVVWLRDLFRRQYVSQPLE